MSHPQKHEQKPNAFTLPVRIYYAETDAGGVVYHSKYLDLFERCRTEWLRQLGHDQRDLIRDHNLVFVVRYIKIDYLKPGRLDDMLHIGLEVEKLGRSQIIFRQHVRRENADAEGGWEELTTASVQIVCVDFAKMKSSPIPDWLRAKLETLQ
jgi:acyl-CoA thioester hydrolase